MKKTEIPYPMTKKRNVEQRKKVELSKIMCVSRLEQALNRANMLMTDVMQKKDN